MKHGRIFLRLIGVLLLVMATLLGVCAGVSFVYDEETKWQLTFCAVGMLVVGCVFLFLFQRKKALPFLWHIPQFEIDRRGSFWVTTGIWILIPFVGMIPYLVTHTFGDFTDAAFESFSGFTTTGSSVLHYPEVISKGLLLWRSITEWMGGLGLMLLVIFLLRSSTLGIKGKSYQLLYEAEFSGTVQRKLHPHLSESVGRMWQVYAVLTLLVIGCLFACGNSLVESICLGMSTVSTGGFMTRSSGMADYSTMSILVVTIFMFASGINVALLYNSARNVGHGMFYHGRGKRVLSDEEFRMYVMVYVFSVLSCVVSFVLLGNGVKESFVYSLFHIASTVSTCGFYLQNPAYWSFWVSVVTFFLVFVGASSGSTGGGIKLKRVMILVKYVKNYFIKMVHPNAVVTVRIDKIVIEKDYVNKIFAFVFVYLMLVALGGFVLTLCGSTISESICMAATNIANLGPSPLMNNMGVGVDYALLPGVAKWTLMFLMLAGRLEVFAIAAVLIPEYWKK